MINVFLDTLPTVWESGDGVEYKLNTDFRIGIQLFLLQQDPELMEEEKAVLMTELLFDYDRTDFTTYKNIPPKTEHEDVYKFFLYGWNHDGDSGERETRRLMDFDVDQWRIHAGFLEKYGINLKTTDMHFWEFMGLLTSLTECAYTRVIDIRQRNIDPKSDKEVINQLIKAKSVYELPEIMSIEQQIEEDEIIEFLGGKVSHRDIPEEIKQQEKDFEEWAYK